MKTILAFSIQLIALVVVFEFTFNAVPGWRGIMLNLLLCGFFFAVVSQIGSHLLYVSFIKSLLCPFPMSFPALMDLPRWSVEEVYDRIELFYQYAEHFRDPLEVLRSPKADLLAIVAIGEARRQLR
jgi:hypothetical protein